MEEHTQPTQTSEVPPIDPTLTPPLAPEIPASSVGVNEANLTNRCIAAVIDSLIALALAVVAGLVFSRLSFPIYIAYMLTRDSLPFLNGQSIGKKAMKIQAVSEAGKSLSGDWAPGLLRNITMVIPLLPLVELIILIVNKDKPTGLRRLGDQIAKTKVINAAA